jgi:mycofactocin system glycosyltransferase
VTARTCEASSSSTDGQELSVLPEAYLLDGRVRRLGHCGEVLLGGEPFRLLRLSVTGAQVLDELCCGRPPRGAAAEALVRRLVAGGFLHPVPPPRPVRPAELAVVVPVRDDEAGAARLLGRLRLELAGTIVVVDDGSSEASAARLSMSVSEAGAVLVRRAHAEGPASARNAARAVADTPLIAFLDADVLPDAGWLDRLLGHFDDETVGAVAPRVAAGSADSVGGSRLAAYESLSSPLDLGPEPGTVGAHRRVSYVPSAALVCRREALEAVGWFDAGLTVGEDVDLCRRFEREGWVVRYEPRSVVHHDVRPDVKSFLRQRFEYGTSAAALDRLHAGTVTPFEGNWWAVAAVVVAGLGLGAGGRRRRFAALLWLALTAVPAGSLRSKLSKLGAGGTSAASAAAVVRAQAWSAAGLATAGRRVWWPAAAAAAVLVPRLRRRVGFALAACELGGRLPLWWNASRACSQVSDVAEPPGYGTVIGYGTLDDLAYGSGVWAGCLRERSLGAVMPYVVRPKRQPQRRNVSPSSPSSRSR